MTAITRSINQAEVLSRAPSCLTWVIIFFMIKLRHIFRKDSITVSIAMTKYLWIIKGYT